MNPTRGLILAAGASSRMGRPKALLTLGGETFVGRLVRLFAEAGCTPVAVVVGAGADALAPRLPPSALCVRHPGWAQGMRSSLRAGLLALPPGPVLLTHVDRPATRPDSLRRLIEASGAHPVVPYLGSRAGHPVLLPDRIRSRLTEPDTTPLREVLSSLGVQALALDDPGILLNVNTPAEYARLAGAHEYGAGPREDT